jgi:hypothetical protein
MTPVEFGSLWIAGENPRAPCPLICFPQEAVSRRRLLRGDQSFLTGIGLPEQAAPFLNFGSKHVLGMPTAASLFRLDEGEDQFPTIGHNGSGDPICIDEALGRVIYLNHDNNFSATFINSSIAQLAYSLLAFREALKEANEIAGSGAFLEGRIPLETVDRFITKMEEIDAKAIEPDSFWLGAISGRC